MKISMENIYSLYRQNAITKPIKRDENVPGINNREKNFDEIRISLQGENALGENEFIKTLSARLSAEVREEPSGEKLDSIKEKIRQGCYEIDVSAIASRILLEGKGGE